MAKLRLIIKIEHPFITLELKNEQGVVIDKRTWKEDNDTSRMLLSGIDKLLAKNKIEIGQLAKIHIETEQARYTSSRISEAVAQTVGYCLGVDSK